VLKNKRKPVEENTTQKTIDSATHTPPQTKREWKHIIQLY